MKVIFCFVFGLMISYTVMAQKKYYLNPKDTMEMKYETFDMEFFNKHKDNYNHLDYKETLEDKTKIHIFGENKVLGFVKQQVKYPYFFVQIKEYYTDGRLQQKGFALGRCKIEKWVECNE